LTNAQIAERLYLTESTVKQHLYAAYKLLKVRNRTQVAKLVQHELREHLERKDQAARQDTGREPVFSASTLKPAKISQPEKSMGDMRREAYGR
jgi:DNA-binding NarL/FixJ family response regulator